MVGGVVEGVGAFVDRVGGRVDGVGAVERDGAGVGTVGEVVGSAVRPDDGEGSVVDVDDGDVDDGEGRPSTRASELEGPEGGGSFRHAARENETTDTAKTIVSRAYPRLVSDIPLTRLASTTLASQMRDIDTVIPAVCEDEA